MREASKLNMDLLFSNSSPSAPAAAPLPASSTSGAAHRITNEPLINFAEHQRMTESWNFPSLPPGSGNTNQERSRKQPVILGRNEWARADSSSPVCAREQWPTLPPSGAARRRASPPSLPPEIPDYGGYYGTPGSVNKKGQLVLRWGQ